jgi:hypothetical protein
VSLDESTLSAVLQPFREARRLQDERERDLLVDVARLKAQVESLMDFRKMALKWALGSGFGGAAVATAVVQAFQAMGS